MNVFRSFLGAGCATNSFLVPRILGANLCTVVQAKAEESAPAPSRPDRLFKRIELEIKGNDPAVIRSYVKFTILAATHLGVRIEKSQPLKKAEKERWTLLKSVHVHKKHRVQYEIRTHFHFVHLAKLTESTGDTLVEYLERNLPEGIGMKVTKVEMQRLPDFLQPPPEKNKSD